MVTHESHESHQARIHTIASELITASERLFVNAPVYQALSRQIAADPELLALAAAARPEQPAVLMLFGTVHYLILRGAEHPLATIYQRLAAGQSAGDDVFPVFRNFCLAFASELRPLLERGRVQTNEVGRSVYLRLGLEWVSESLGADPLCYVEIGASAGLNLGWDAFSMELVRPDGARTQRGPQDSPVRLSCELRGAQTPTERGAVLPRIEGRLGLEIDPPDLDSAEARDWLLAFVWAEHGDRLQRLRGAIDLAVRAGHRVVRADATTGLLGAAAELPAHHRICVAHTFLLSQLPPPALDSLHAQLARLSHDRDVVQVGAEWIDHGTQLLVKQWTHGALQSSLVLAKGDAHGRQIEWLLPRAS